MSASTSNSIEPPKDGSLIFATGNLMYEVTADEWEMDSPTVGISAEHFADAIYWDADAQLWLWASNRMSVMQCFSDRICFHWWTALEQEAA